MQKDRLPGVLALVFLVLLIVSATLAHHYWRESKELSARLGVSRYWAGGGSGSPTGAVAAAMESERLFELLSVIKGKDSTIEELRLQVAELKGERPPRPPRPRPLPPPVSPTLKPASPEPPAPNPAKPVLPDLDYLRERLHVGFAEQASFLSSINSAEMTEEEQQNHAKVVERVRLIQAELARLSDAGTADAAAIEGAKRQILRHVQGLGDLMDKERDVIFFNAARQVGYDSAGARDFSRYSVYANEMTSLGLLIRRAWAAADACAASGAKTEPQGE